MQDSIDKAKLYLESNAVDKAKESLTEGKSLLTERQKLILLSDKSEFGWKTVQEYTQHELPEDDQDGKNIRRAGELAKKSLKSVAAKKSKKQGGFPSSPSLASTIFQCSISTQVILYILALSAAILFTLNRGSSFKTWEFFCLRKIWSLESSMFAGSYFYCF